MKTKQQKIVEILDEILSVNIQHDIEAGEINVKIINRQEAAATIIEQLEPEGEVSDKDITYWKGSNLGYHRKQFMKNSLRLEQLTMEKSPPQQPSDSAGEEERLAYNAKHGITGLDHIFDSAGEEVYVKSDEPTNIRASEMVTQNMNVSKSNEVRIAYYLKKLTRPTVSEEEAGYNEMSKIVDVLVEHISPTEEELNVTSNEGWPKYNERILKIATEIKELN